MASHLHYLTVQDILWINTQVTGKVLPFNYANLEEATYYQYAYGDSKHLVSQAARFLSGFPKMNPIEAGNDATVFVACLTFLMINGMKVDLEDSKAVGWFDAVKERKVDAGDAIKSVAKKVLDHHDSAPEVRKTVRGLLAQYKGTLAKFDQPVPSVSD